MNIPFLTKKKKKTNKIGYFIAAISDPQSSYAEAYRQLQVNLSFASIDKKFQIIQIASAEPGEGKTMTSLNLAGVYQEIGKKVLLIDMDFRHPKLHRAFELKNEIGIAEYMLDKATKADLIKKTKTGIDLVVRGEHITRPNVVFESQKMKDLMNEFKNDYDIVIIDCPPVLIATDAVLISHLSDAVVFVVSEMNTAKAQALEAVDVMRKNGANIVGIVDNFVKARRNDYYYRYKYRYSYYYRTDDSQSKDKE